MENPKSVGIKGKDHKCRRGFIPKTVQERKVEDPHLSLVSAASDSFL